jgi:Lon protease-like protein
MTTDRDADDVAADFSGHAPLFPLPNVVLFPQALLPLHIFETRYRQMTADALAADSLIAMALLRESDEARSDEAPEIWPTVGLGRIVAHQQLPDGRYYLVLRGTARCRVLYEEPTNKLYRIGRLELVTDVEPPLMESGRLTRRLLQRFSQLFPAVKEHAIWQQVTERTLPLGAVCDLLVSALPLKPEGAQQFLEELDSAKRCEMLWEVLRLSERRVKSESNRGFPPVFSAN